jgi:hypothetical protein
MGGILRAGADVSLSKMHRGRVAARLQGLAEALLRCAAKGDFLVWIVENEGGFVAGSATEIERSLEVEDEGTIKPGEGWGG